MSDDEVSEPLALSERPEPVELPDYGCPDPESGLEPQDLDLIRWMLSLSPIERLRYVQRFASGVRRLKLAGRA